MVYLLKMVIFHGKLLNNQMVLFFVAKYHEFSPFWAVIPQPELKDSGFQRSIAGDPRRLKGSCNRCVMELVKNPMTHPNSIAHDGSMVLVS